jgi:hypothetical protein
LSFNIIFSFILVASYIFSEFRPKKCQSQFRNLQSFLSLSLFGFPSQHSTIVINCFCSFRMKNVSLEIFLLLSSENRLHYNKRGVLYCLTFFSSFFFLYYLLNVFFICFAIRVSLLLSKIYI